MLITRSISIDVAESPSVLPPDNDSIGETVRIPPTAAAGRYVAKSIRLVGDRCRMHQFVVRALSATR